MIEQIKYSLKDWFNEPVLIVSLSLLVVVGLIV
jgi:hypothetical protein